MENKNQYKEGLNQVHEDASGYVGFINKSEDEKLREAIYRSPMEKLHLFTTMLRREASFKKAKIYR